MALASVTSKYSAPEVCLKDQPKITTKKNWFARQKADGLITSKRKRKARIKILCHKLFLLLGHRPKSYYKCLSKWHLTNSLHSNSGKGRECNRSCRLCLSCLIHIQTSSRSRPRDATDKIVAAISQPLCQQSDRVKAVMYHVAKYARRCGKC